MYHLKALSVDKGETILRYRSRVIGAKNSEKIAQSDEQPLVEHFEPFRESTSTEEPPGDPFPWAVLREPTTESYDEGRKGDEKDLRSADILRLQFILVLSENDRAGSPQPVFG